MTTKILLSGYIPTSSGITDQVADDMWPALGKEYVAVCVLKVDKHSESADSEKERGATLKIVDLELATSDEDQDALRRALRALYRDRTAEGTLDEVNPRDPADGLTAAGIVDNASTLGTRGQPRPGDDQDDELDLDDSEDVDEDSDDDWEYDAPEGTKGDNVTELQTAGAS